MATQLAETPLPLGYRIPPTNPDHPSDPEWIIYREVDLDFKENGHLNVYYLNDTDPPKKTDIRTFIASILNKESQPGPGAVEPTSPLDLNCKQYAYIVFKLSTRRNWQFSNSGDCFVTKDNKNGKYFGLKHVMPDGTIVDENKPLSDGCRILYFKADSKEEEYDDDFNLRVDLLLKPYFNERTGKTETRRTTIIIDPDIRNPGGSQG